MMTSSNGSIFCVTAGHLCGEFTGHRWIPLKETPTFGVLFDLRLNIRLSKQPRRRWFETPSCSLRRHCNVPLLFLHELRIATGVYCYYNDDDNGMNKEFKNMYSTGVVPFVRYPNIKLTRHVGEPQWPFWKQMPCAMCYVILIRASSQLRGCLCCSLFISAWIASFRSVEVMRWNWCIQAKPKDSSFC